MDIATLTSTYLAAPGDVVAANVGEALPNTTTGNTITPMIDGRRYFRAIKALLQAMGTGPTVAQQFFYVTGWWMHLAAGPGATTTAAGTAAAPTSAFTHTADTDPSFQLVDDTAGPYPVMADLLVQKAQAGVDVRVMAWANPFILMDRIASQAPGYWNVVVGNLAAVRALRAAAVGPAHPLAQRANALSVGHPIGAIHMKMVIAHDGTKPWAFVGGIDFQQARVADEMHPGAEFWHDIAVAVDGPAIQAIYDTFKDLWNEQRSRTQRFLVNGAALDAVVAGTTAVPSRTLPAAGTGPHSVQVCRTLPQFHFGMITPPGAVPLSFAPNGKFEVIVAWRKAIAGATQYVYMEDQSFWSQDVMDWLNARIKAQPNLKVILLTGGSADPVDPPNDGPMVEAVNNHLLAGLTAPQRARVGVFMRVGVFVHAKITLIDDHWMIAGSANCMRRSLFTDGEISVGMVDSGDTAVKTMRKNVWGAHFGKTTAQRASLDNLDHALAVWDPTWGSSPPYPLPAARITRSPLPMPPASVPFDPSNYQFSDADSRQSFF